MFAAKFETSVCSSSSPERRTTQESNSSFIKYFMYLLMMFWEIEAQNANQNGKNNKNWRNMHMFVVLFVIKIPYIKPYASEN
jgi:hypothetical protein